MKRIFYTLLYLLALPFAVLLFVWEYYTRKTYIDATIKKGKR